MLAPGKRWHQENAGTRKTLAPGKGWHQGNAGTRKGVQGGKVSKNKDWNRDSLPRPDTEGQITGTTAKSYNCSFVCAVASYSEIQGRDNQDGAPSDSVSFLKLLMSPPYIVINLLQLSQGSHKFFHTKPEHISW